MAFVKGKSGNPGGRPKDEFQIKQLAQSFSREAVKRLAHWMRSDDPRASIPAASALLDRGHGKPHQEQTVTIDDKRDATDWTREELVAFLSERRADSGGISPEAGRGRKPDRVH